MPIIEVTHVSKEFRLGETHALRHRLRDVLRRRGSGGTAAIKALNDVSLTIERGEVVGIIGHNGAGKSTLLKLLSRITVPSSGSVVVRGTVAPLIEIGAGLVPDLTGRENIYLNGAILGLSRREIEGKIDDIVAFAELEPFIDTPVKRYSSGMAMRLGFSIASSISADVLIIDEVLAVGDISFQRKCFDRIERVIKSKAQTVLIVSHNIRHIQRACQRVILLDHGRVIRDGLAGPVCDAFYDLIDARAQGGAESPQLTPGVNNLRTTGQVALHSFRLLDEHEAPVTSVVHGGSAIVEMTLDVHEDLVAPELAIGIQTPDLTYVAVSRSEWSMTLSTLRKGRHTVRCLLKNLLLLPGIYAFRMGVTEGSVTRTIFYADDVSRIRITAGPLKRSLVAGEAFVALQSQWQLCDSRGSQSRADLVCGTETEGTS